MRVEAIEGEGNDPGPLLSIQSAQDMDGITEGFQEFLDGVSGETLFMLVDSFHIE